MEVLRGIEEENKRLDSYKHTGIFSDGDVDKYNRAIDRIQYLDKFLTVNESIINGHRSMLKKVKETIDSYIKRGESFFEEVMKR